ncbi:MAG: hypothetical protein ACRD88_13915, partial [Terriglobia bacterium]
MSEAADYYSEIVDQEKAVMQRLGIALLTIAGGIGLFSAQAQQAPPPNPENLTGVLKQIIPGHYAFVAGRFNSGVIA